MYNYWYKCEFTKPFMVTCDCFAGITGLYFALCDFYHAIDSKTIGSPQGAILYCYNWSCSIFQRFKDWKTIFSAWYDGNS